VELLVMVEYLVGLEQLEHLVVAQDNMSRVVELAIVVVAVAAAGLDPCLQEAQGVVDKDMKALVVVQAMVVLEREEITEVQTLLETAALGLAMAKVEEVVHMEPQI
jgi:hypothetical protein